MNIFALNISPVVSAQIQHDKHVVKMVLESAQMLSSAFDKSHNPPYKRAYFNHPCTKWTRFSRMNYSWLITHAKALAREYTWRYGKIHASTKVIQWCENNMDKIDFKQNDLTEFAQAMPEEYKNKNSVQAYQDYYVGTKLNSNPRWTNREIPWLFAEHIN